MSLIFLLSLLNIKGYAQFSISIVHSVEPRMYNTKYIIYNNFFLNVVSHYD